MRIVRIKLTQESETMAKTKRPTKDTQKSAKSTTAKFTDEEVGAMKARVKELKAAAGEAEGESAVLAKIATMQAADRALGERLHKIIKASAPALSPRL